MYDVGGITGKYLELEGNIYRQPTDSVGYEGSI